MHKTVNRRQTVKTITTMATAAAAAEKNEQMYIVVERQPKFVLFAIALCLKERQRELSLSFPQ